MAVFLAMTAIRVPVYIVFGLLTWSRLLSGLMLLPAALLGAVVGQRLHVGVRDSTFRRVVALGLLVLGVLLIRRSAQL